ncbi:MAG: DUF5618 family protein [Bacteroidales bacterium]|nr:DUF5618 family protein [Bacteroidales bacterium]
MEKKNPVEEARRYVDNAKKLLVENGELDTETHLYGDRKYVRMAGDTLWKGVLHLLDAVFHVRSDRRTRVHIEDYQEAIGRRDGKLAKLVHTGYDTMHLYMGYDGVLDKDTCDAGFRLANDIIDRCAKLI